MKVKKITFYFFIFLLISIFIGMLFFVFQKSPYTDSSTSPRMSPANATPITTPVDIKIVRIVSSIDGNTMLVKADDNSEMSITNDEKILRIYKRQGSKRFPGTFDDFAVGQRLEISKAASSNFITIVIDL